MGKKYEIVLEQSENLVWEALQNMGTYQKSEFIAFKDGDVLEITTVSKKASELILNRFL